MKNKTKLHNYDPANNILLRSKNSKTKENKKIAQT